MADPEVDMEGKDKTLYDLGSDPISGELTIPHGDHTKKIDQSFTPQPPAAPPEVPQD